MIRLGWTIILFSVFWGCSTESETLPTRPISCEQALELDSPLLDEVQLLGIPLEGRYASDEMAYARNIWDMRLFGDRLYLGGGNSSNNEPASNAGPVPVVAWDLGTKQFVEEYDVDDEQIDRFYVFDNSLVIPGHDSRKSWASGTLYRKDDSNWNPLGEIPHAIHVYAMIQFNGQLLAGLGTPAGSGVAYSLDGGLNWETNYLGGLRIHEFFQLNGTVFALDIFASEFDLPSVFEMGTKDEWKERRDLSVETLFPGVELDGRTIRVVRSATLAEGVLYIGGYTHNDHQFLPFGLFAADDLSVGSVRLTEVEFPKGWKPWDLVEKDDRVYVLANKSIDTGALWHSSILEISSNGECTEVRRFQGDGVARSFEMNADAIWVSFGAETPLAEVESQELGFSRNLGMLGQLPR